jgi:hypothetical protein
MPSVIELFSNAVSYLLTKPWLVLVVLVPNLILTYVDVNNRALEGAEFAPIVSELALMGVLFFAAIIALVVLQLGVLKYITADALRQPLQSFGAAVSWAGSNILGFIWIGLLSALVVFGGLLLIVPGIIAIAHLAIVQYVYAHEGVRGMAALRRSRELLWGSAGAVWWRLLGLFVLFMLLAIVLGLLGGLLASVLPAAASIWPEVVASGLASAIGTVLMVHYAAHIYAWSVAQPPLQVPAERWYQTLAWVGIPAIVIFTIGIAILAAVTFSFLLQDTFINLQESQLNESQASLSPDEQAELETFLEENRQQLEIN